MLQGVDSNAESARARYGDKGSATSAVSRHRGHGWREVKMDMGQGDGKGSWGLKSGALDQMLVRGRWLGDFADLQSTVQPLRLPAGSLEIIPSFAMTARRAHPEISWPRLLGKTSTGPLAAFLFMMVSLAFSTFYLS